MPPPFWNPAAGVCAFFMSIVFAAPAAADETPKHGGILTYMIPADAPPSLDGHREGTYATVHAVARACTPETASGRTRKRSQRAGAPPAPGTRTSSCNWRPSRAALESR